MASWQELTGMRKFIGKTENELLAMGILQIAPNFGFEALRYSS